MAEQAGEKKHDATPYRREKAREDGQVPRSPDLASALLLLVSIMVLNSIGPQLLGVLKSIATDQFQQPIYWHMDSGTALANLVGQFQKAAFALLPLLGAVFLTAIVVNLGQIGFLFLPEKLGFDLSRVNPLNGLSRLFSLQSASRLGFGLLKITVVVASLAIGFWDRWDDILQIGSMQIENVAHFVWKTTMDVSMQTAIVLLILAIAEYAFQRWKFEQDLRMTDEEIREEMKTTQGDPSLKARRRRVQRQLAAQRIQHDVPKADVIITNPTELAIAIRYDIETMQTPIVVAKGAGTIAARIRRLALEHGIPIVERKPLAQALFKSVEIGQPIPVQEFAAVAEVLRYVYQIQGRRIPTATQQAA